MGIMSGLGRVIGSRAGIGALGATAFGLGVASQVGPAARDAAFDVAFDDPDADVAFTGRKMSARFLAGTAMGGTTGSFLRGPFSAPGDYFAANPVVPGPVNTDGSLRAGGIGAGIGGVVGGVAGRLFGGAGSKRGIAIGAGIGSVLGGTAGLGSVRGAAATTVGGGLTGAVAGGVKGFKSGSIAKGIAGIGLGAVGGTAVGAMAGGAMIAGSLAPAAAGARSYVSNNQTFLNESPYAGRTSSGIATSLSASGDIVLGMHNSRRG